jgi:hypothetical protein
VRIAFRYSGSGDNAVVAADLSDLPRLRMRGPQRHEHERGDNGEASKRDHRAFSQTRSFSRSIDL